MTYQLIQVQEDADWQAYHDIRRTMIFENQNLHSSYRPGVYNDQHPDEHAADKTPLLLKLDGQPIGTTRLDNRGDKTGVVRLVAITQELQGQGHGRVFSVMVDDYASLSGIDLLYVNAAPEAVGYYEKLGWERHVWDAEELTGWAADCIQMRKPTSRPAAPADSFAPK